MVPASNNDLDMFGAMRAASFLQKVATSDPTALSATAAVRMATIGGARALGMDKQIGSLEPGKRADVIIVSMSATRQTPMYDPLSHLVYVTRGDDVQTTDRQRQGVDAGSETAHARSRRRSFAMRRSGRQASARLSRVSDHLHSVLRAQCDRRLWHYRVAGNQLKSPLLRERRHSSTSSIQANDSPMH
jgi:hypothetical protein